MCPQHLLRIYSSVVYIRGTTSEQVCICMYSPWCLGIQSFNARRTRFKNYTAQETSDQCTGGWLAQNGLRHGVVIHSCAAAWRCNVCGAVVNQWTWRRLEQSKPSLFGIMHESPLYFTYIPSHLNYNVIRLTCTGVAKCQYVLHHAPQIGVHGTIFSTSSPGLYLCGT